jgi:homoserine O-succinyltransferase/O-acetyltransferase
MIKVAILDLYEGQANQGMRCIREILREWSEHHGISLLVHEFEVRIKQEVPDLSYDLYISSGGPGSPLESIGTAWEEAYLNWVSSVEEWNGDQNNSNKKFVFFICHSFQLVCRHYGIGEVTKRKSTAFGVFPVHVLPSGQTDPVLEGLNDPFYVVDSRDWQVIHPDLDKLHKMGMQILCIEKYRPHVPYVQAIMALRLNPYMIGTQFHPEADAIGMSMYLQTDEKKQVVIEAHGLEKWQSMVHQLNDPDKIMWTYSHIIPNFINLAYRQLKAQLVEN